MSINFKKIASRTLSLSHLMEDREQMKTEQLIGTEVTVTDFDFATIVDTGGVQKTFPVLIFAEHPNHYYNGGALLSKLCIAWAAEFEGDVEAASDALHNAGGVKLRFSSTRTRSGNSLTSIEVI